MNRFLMGIVMFSGLVMTGVAADGPKSAEGQAVFCAKCEKVWVKSPRTVGKTTVYVSTQKMECPDCKTAVESFFSGGKFEHTCGKCGTLIACQEAQRAAEKTKEAAPSEHGKAADGAHQHHQAHPKN